jgi:hypothetical protein
MHRPPGLILTLILILAACGGTKSGGRSTVDTAQVYVSSPSAPPQDVTLRLVITSDPKVYADGHPVTLGVLDSLLTALKTAYGEVWLYREESDPHVAAQQDSLVDAVLGAITRHDLVVRVAKQPDFSDQARKHRPAPDSERP